MLKLSPIDMLLTGLPESILIILSIYSLAKKPIDKKRYLMLAVLCSIYPYFIRLLPISFGVHTILIIFVQVLLSVYIIQIDIIKAIAYSLITIVILSFCEAVSIFTFSSIFNIDVQAKLGNPFGKALYALPHLFLFGLIIMIIRRINFRSKL